MVILKCPCILHWQRSFVSSQEKKKGFAVFVYLYQLKGGKVSKFYILEDLNKRNCQYLKGLVILK